MKLLPMFTEPTKAAKAVMDDMLAPSNYKLPTQRVKIASGSVLLDQVAYCLDFYLGGHETKDLGNGLTEIGSLGYYHYIGA